MNDQQHKRMKTQDEYKQHWRPAMNAESIQVKLREIVEEWSDRGRTSKMNTYKSPGTNTYSIKTADATKDKPEFWFALAEWAKHHGRLSPYERNFAFIIGLMLSKDKKPSLRQITLAAKIRRQSIKEGYSDTLIAIEP
jgi:hypothetical protein